jgi:ATP-dependent Clp protease adaptor protein ClpS
MTECLEELETIDITRLKESFSTNLDSFVEAPKKYNVVLYNDDFTPMEFVVRLLQDVFRLNEEVATNIMLQVHYNGKGVCGSFVKDIAQTKANQVVEQARKLSYPLLCQAEAM